MATATDDVLPRGRIRRRIAASILSAVAIGFPQQLLAHTKPLPIREIVRIRGTVAVADLPCAAVEFSVRVLGKIVRLCDSDVRRIAVAADAANEGTLPAVVYDLQGERVLLVQIGGASPETKVTILAEWRPGRRDLFLIDLDICQCASTVSNPDLGSTDVNSPLRK